MRVALEQKDARLVPDIGVRVSFLASKAPAASGAAPVAAPRGALVPAAAIVQRDGHPVVFVVVGDKAVQHVVAPAAQDVGALKSIPAGVSAGDLVVLSPPPTLQDGAAVRADDTKQ